MEITLTFLTLFYIALTAYYAWNGFVAHYLAALSLLVLPVFQFLFIYYNKLGSIFIYQFSSESLLFSVIALYIVGFVQLISSLLYRRALRTRHLNLSFLLTPNASIILCISSISLALISLSLAQASVDSGQSLAGRGTFSGVGVVMGILIVLNFVCSRLRQSPLPRLSLLISLSTLLYLSRIFFLVNLVTISAPYLRRLRPGTRILLLSLLLFLAIVAFLYSGELKHLLGRGLTLEESTLSLLSYNPFEDTGSQNLGIALTYTIGIEAGSSLADCINTMIFNQDYLGSLYYLISSIQSILPGFILRFFGIGDLPSTLVCTQPIVQSVLHLFIQVFDTIGVFLFGITLSFFCIQIDSPKSFLNRLFPSSCLLLFLPLFWVRGTFQLSISIFVAVTVSWLFTSRLLSLKRFTS